MSSSRLSSESLHVREPSPRGAGWWLSLYPAAAEGGGCFVPSRRRPPDTGFAQADPERASQQAARRARAKTRRYCAANRLNRLGTLTYRGASCHDPQQLRADVGLFFRGLRKSLGGRPLPYVWVPEWHKTGHGQHVHFAVGRFIPRRVIDAFWGHGFVHIKLLGDLPVGAGSLAEARQAARYLSKYVGKAFDDARVPGLHRYEVAQGFQPARIRIYGRSVETVLRRASKQLGCEPERVWRSQDEPQWAGPPSVWAAWPG